MKILFLMFHGFYAANGISKKILDQVSALRENGAEVHVCHYEVNDEGRRQWLVDSEVIQDLGCGSLAKLRKRMDFSAITEHIRNGRYDLLYFRYFHNSNPFTIHFLKAVRNMGVRTVVEVPTFPYDGEFVTRSEKVYGAVDKCFRHAFFSIPEKTVSFSDVPDIFGCPAIVISNGVNLSRIKMVEDRPLKPGQLHMTAVAEIHFWHGIDRVLKGLAEYRNKPHGREVVFHIVGEPYGELERKTLENLVRDNALEDAVVLHGPQYGEELDRIFNMTDIAIGSLGRHRSGVYVMNSLKNREYAARGLSFVYSETDPDFEGKAFILKMPADETPADIQSIVSFRENLKYSPSQIRSSVEPLSWKIQMGKVLREL